VHQYVHILYTYSNLSLTYDRFNHLAVEILSCVDVQCGQNAQCLEISVGNPECRCLPGFYGDGLFCYEPTGVDVNTGTTRDKCEIKANHDFLHIILMRILIKVERQIVDKFETYVIHLLSAFTAVLAVLTFAAVRQDTLEMD
jgi:hypothetical protein